MLYFFNFVIVFVLSFYEISNTPPGQFSVSPKARYFVVTKVVDGDTFWVNDGTPKGKKVRLIGVDAPESRNTGRKKIGYFGKQSKVYLEKFLTGRKVRLESDVDTIDRYGRALAYAWLEDGTFINAWLIRQGYAQVMTVPPNVKYADMFVKLQQEARKNKKGLWKR